MGGVLFSHQSMQGYEDENYSFLWPFTFYFVKLHEDTGFITAASPTDTKLNWWTFAQDSMTTRVTSFVEELRPNYTRVRVTFVNSKSSSGSYGQYSEKDTVIFEAGAYEAVFNRVGNEIFVRKGTQ